jgi:hypothetical protein
MRQHYYVIYFDEETKEWIHDIDTESIRFDTGTIWNEKGGKWENGYLKGDVQQGKVNALMNDGLQFLNNISAVRHLVGGI